MSEEKIITTGKNLQLKCRDKETGEEGWISVSYLLEQIFKTGFDTLKVIKDELKN